MKYIIIVTIVDTLKNDILVLGTWNFTHVISLWKALGHLHQNYGNTGHSLELSAGRGGIMFLCINLIVPCRTLTWQNSELVNVGLVFILIREMIFFLIQMRKGNEIKTVRKSVRRQFGTHRVNYKHPP